MSGSSSEARNRLFSLVREIREDARALRGQLATVSELTDLQENPQPSDALKALLRRAHADLTAKGFQGRAPELVKLGKEFPRLQAYGDRANEVRTAIERAVAEWPPSSMTSVAAVKGAVEKSREALEDVIFGCCRLTIPADVERQLTKMSVGKSFDFEARFKESLPDADKRKLILTELAQQKIGGWVDLGNGLIYRLSPDRRVRVLTYLSPLLSVLVAIGILILIGNLDELCLNSPANLDDAKEMVAAFIAVLGGALVHLVVENIKQMQMRSAPIVAIGNLLDWMHLRWAGLSLMAVPLLITVIGMMMLGVKSDQVETYALAGYSADSISGLFLTRFDSSAGTYLKGLTKRLKPATASGDPQA